MKFKICHNVKYYRIHLIGTICKGSHYPAKEALSHAHTNVFYNPSRPANSSFLNKPPKTTRSINPHNSTCTPINSTHIQLTQFLPTALFDFELPPPKLPATLITKIL